jgi:hypothetical protein
MGVVHWRKLRMLNWPFGSVHRNGRTIKTGWSYRSFWNWILAPLLVQAEPTPMTLGKERIDEL